MKRVYKDVDCDISLLNNKTIGVIGYGIQGRAQSLNLRDSGCNVIIGNRDDKYRELAKKDGFKVYDIAEVAKQCNIILMLIPDESHKHIFNTFIKKNLSDGDLIILAHGYSIRYNKISIPKNIDVGLLAPRFPGKPIRNYYLQGRGIPAFLDIINDFSNNALNKILSIGQAIGYSKAGIIPVSYKEETELDLFIEHFIGPLFISAVEQSLSYLVKRGYASVPSIIELYMSGERGSMWSAYAKKGLFAALNENASPTCKFGISSYYNKTFNLDLKRQMEFVIDRIKNGEFAKDLESEELNNYSKSNEFFEKKQKSFITKTELEVNDLLNDYL